MRVESCLMKLIFAIVIVIVRLITTVIAIVAVINVLCCQQIRFLAR